MSRMAHFALRPPVYLDPATEPRKGTLIKDGVILFYGEPSPFSNFYPCKFTENEVDFHCVEQYLLYHRAIVYNIPRLQHAALCTYLPLELKRMTRHLPREETTTWFAVSESIMLDGLRAKFKQDPYLKQLLLDTGSNKIGESSEYDHYWGTGLSMRHCHAFRPAFWQGKNRLGELLMQVREELRKVMDLKCYKCPECN